MIQLDGRTGESSADRGGIFRLTGVPAGSQRLLVRYMGYQPGFMAMSLMPDTLLVQAVDYSGRMLYRTAITP